MTNLNKRLIRIIKSSLGQFIAVILVIMIGISIYISLTQAMVDVENSLYTYYKQTNFYDMYTKLVKIPEKDIDTIKGVVGIASVEGRVVLEGSLIEGDEKVNTRIISYRNNQTINTLYLSKGNFIKNPLKEVLLLETYANAKNIHINDTINLQMFGKEYGLKVRGIVSSAEYIYLIENEQNLLPRPGEFGIVYLSEELARTVSGLGNEYNELMFKLDDNTNKNVVKNRLDKKLDKYGVKRIIPREEQLGTRLILEDLKGNKKTSGAVPMVFLIVAGIIIAVTLSRKVKNDRLTIGILKALGYSNNQIIFHYTKYSLIIGVLGAVAGSIISSFLSKGLTAMYLSYYNLPILEASYPFKPMISSIILSGLFCAVFGIWGSLKILDIDPATAMRPEPAKQISVKLYSKITPFIRYLGFINKLVVRSIFRSFKKLAAISMGIGFTFAILIVVVSLFVNMFNLFNDHFGDFLRMDYDINFERPLNEKDIKDLEKIANIQYIEPKIDFPYELISGHKKQAANIIGLKDNTKFYEFTNLSGEIIKLPEKGLLVSEGLSRVLGVEKGDSIVVDTYLPDKAEKEMIVVDIIKQGLGINAYINIENMQDKLLSKGVITGVYVNSQFNIKEELKNVKGIMSVKSLKELKDTYMDLMSISIASMTVMIIFAGILGYAIVYNSNVMIIDERRMEFASLRVMGFTNKEIIKILGRETFIMTLIGFVVGNFLSKILMRGLSNVFSTEIYTLDETITIKAYVIAIIATLIFIYVANLISSIKIKRIDFIEALKSRIV